MNDFLSIKFCSKCNSTVFTTEGFCNECKSDLNIKEPSFITKVVNFSEAIIEHTKAGLPKRSEEEINNIMKICESCELYNLESQSCLKCGCKLKTKISWAEQKCPIGKW